MKVWLPSSLHSFGFKIWASLSIAFSDTLDRIGLGFGSSSFESALVISSSGSGFGYGASCSGCDSGWGNGSDGLGCGSSSNSEFEFGLVSTPFCNLGSSGVVMDIVRFFFFFFPGNYGNEKVNGNANLPNERESLIKTKERKKI